MDAVQEMKTLHVIVENKRATYQLRDGAIVCGNENYQIKFTFDSTRWNTETAEKTARFRWNGAYVDVPFTGDTCPVPCITNAKMVEVGVYDEEGGLDTTTPAEIPCERSILCGSNVAQPEAVEKYRDAAFDAAERAEAAADRAEAAGGVADMEAIVQAVLAALPNGDEVYY